MPQQYDCIIVGAGAAGCVLASRLSEDSSRDVLLLEAGPDTPPGSVPSDIADVYATSYFNRAYFWPGLQGYWRRRGIGSAGAFPQARVMGGGGSVMGMVSLRGVARDYDEWEQAGAHGWGWRDVLPYFRKLETDCDFENALHGLAGPLPIRRLPRASWPPLAHAIEAYCSARSIPFIEDMNADFGDGYGMVPMCNTGAMRASSALCYLDAPVRSRPNLSIQSRATVSRIVFEGARAVGVAVELDGRERRYFAREVLLAAGAIFSPALLMRSGLGPGPDLHALGIDVVADLPGVGANLQNHPILFVAMHLRRRARQSVRLRTTPSVSLRYSSAPADPPLADLYINVQSKTSWNPLGLQIANLAPALLKPQSRGRVSLVSPDRSAHPQIEFDFMSDERDVKRMADALERTIDIAAFCRSAIDCGEAFPLRFSDRVRRLNQLTAGNRVKATLLAALFDLAPGLADVVLTSAAGEPVRLAEIAGDRARLEEHVREHIAGVFHPVGTCRMGLSSDGEAVVDAQGRVHGIGGLRVADASIMPTVPAGNTNVPTMMLAEKIADAMRRMPE